VGAQVAARGGRRGLGDGAAADGAAADGSAADGAAADGAAADGASADVAAVAASNTGRPPAVSIVQLH